MFRRVLIANRGEIALRVIRACRELGIETRRGLLRGRRGRALPAPGRRGDLHRPGRRARSRYLNIPAIIAAAEIADVEAIHPGYGFLSENAHFAEVCRVVQDRVHRPDARGDRAAGRQGRARASWRAAAGVPVVPRPRRAGRRRGRRRSRSRSEIGYPVHDQGRGRRRRARHARRAQRRRAWSPASTRRAAEAEAAFGDGTRLPREVRREPAPRRGPDPRRQARQRRPPRRARLLGPAPPPEAGRGVALARRSRPSCASEMGAAAVRVAAQARLPQRRHGRVPGRPRRQLLLHRGQRAHPGRAPGDRAGHRHRPHPGADPRRRRRAAALHAGRHHVQRGHAIECRINAEDPDARLPPSPGPDRALRAARRARACASTRHVLRRLPHPAELRLA